MTTRGMGRKRRVTLEFIKSCDWLKYHDQTSKLANDDMLECDETIYLIHTMYTEYYVKDKNINQDGFLAHLATFNTFTDSKKKAMVLEAKRYLVKEVDGRFRKEMGIGQTCLSNWSRDIRAAKKS